MDARREAYAGLQEPLYAHGARQRGGDPHFDRGAAGMRRGGFECAGRVGADRPAGAGKGNMKK